MKRAEICIPLLLLLTGCKSGAKIVEVPVPVESVSYVNDLRTHERVDSIYVSDSIYLDRRGDTVVLERWHTHVRERLRHDTIHHERVDTVTLTRTLHTTEIKEVSRPLRRWQKILIWLGAITLLGATMLLIRLIRRKMSGSNK